MPRRRRKNKKYSAELKMQAIQSYLNGEGGLDVVCRKYGILSNHQLRDWILWYNTLVPRWRNFTCLQYLIFMTDVLLHTRSAIATTMNWFLPPLMKQRVFIPMPNLSSIVTEDFSTQTRYFTKSLLKRVWSKVCRALADALTMLRWRAGGAFWSLRCTTWKCLQAANLSFPPLRITYTFTILVVTRSVWTVWHHASITSPPPRDENLPLLRSRGRWKNLFNL